MTDKVGEAFRPPAASLPPWLSTRKRNRLDLEVYRQPGRFFVTINTEGRRSWLTESAVAKHCIEELGAACARYDFDLLAYCVMPDHMHVLVSGEGGSDLIGLVHRFKQQTGYWFRNRAAAGGLKASPTLPSDRPPLWQKSFYDHVLRQDEDVGDVIRYILENPVRAGLVREAREYPFVWSAYGVPAELSL
jgi:putative transposase